MKSPSMKYDLNIGNVSNWRKQELKAWTPQTTARWTRMRESAKSRSRAPLSNRFDPFTSLCRWSERLFQIAVIAAGFGLAFILVNIASAVFSGRVEAILEAIKASH